MDTSVIIPLYNEAKTICKVIEDIRASMSGKGKCEIVVVDDASTDGVDRKALAEAADRLIEHSRNLGYGAALKTGIKHSQGDRIVIIDADGTYPANAIPALLDELNEADMVVGARTGEDVHIPLLRQPAKFVLAKLANFLADSDIPDLNSGLRAFKKKDFQHYIKLLPNGFSFTTTITLAYTSNDLTIKYVPINYHRRQGSKSKIRPISDTLNILKTIVRTVVFFDPLKVCVPLSLIFAGLAILVLIVSAAAMENVMDGTVAVLALSAIQIMVIGIIADLIIRRIDK